MTKEDKYVGCLVGLAVGDAIGMPVEFMRQGAFEPVTNMRYGAGFNLPAGYWTDDTSMALCLADSLIELGYYDSYNVMDKYWLWRLEGYRSSTGKCFDIGNQTSTAINEFIIKPVVDISQQRNQDAGNGSIMRLAPIVIAGHSSGLSQVDVMELAKISARETHFSYEAEAGTALFGGMLYNAITATSKDQILKFKDYKQDEHSTKILDSLNNAENLSVDDLGPTGYIIDTLQCALWAFINYDNFKDGMLAVVNLGGDSDTIGAVYGQLAGAYYGYSNIPKAWLNKLHKQKEISNIAKKLAYIKDFTLQKSVTRFNEDAGKYTSKTVVKVVNKDITKLKVDVIVNAANSELVAGGGVCGAIFNAAGYDDMAEACQKIGYCETGDAVITPSFNLPCKWVVHTVGPIYNKSNVAESAELLQSCIWQSLYLAEDKRAQSIAFPLISTGVFGYPKQDAKKTILNAISTYIADNPHSPISKIFVCEI